MLIQLAELREDTAAHVALEADRRHCVGDRLVHYLNASIDGGQTGDPVLELIHQCVVVKGLRDVAGLVVVRRGQLREVNRAGALKEEGKSLVNIKGSQAREPQPAYSHLCSKMWETLVGPVAGHLPSGSPS